MRIINQTTNSTLTNYPDIFVDSKERESDEYIKDTIDYFNGEALRQYGKAMSTYIKNYLFCKGELTPEDFYEVDNQTDGFVERLEGDGFLDKLSKDDGLPSYVQNYSIMNQPLNMLIGEEANQPDNAFVKAFDSYSQSEQFEFITQNIQAYAGYKIQQKIMESLARQGVDPTDPNVVQQIQAMTEKEMQENISTYTSLAERWGNTMLEALKMQFNMREKRSMMWGDLLKTGRERIHIYEDNSATGFSVEDVNPKNAWKLSLPDRKYYKDAYAAGIIEILEISDIINKFKLTKKEVDHLRGKLNKKSSPGSSGINSITYEPRIDYYVERLKSLEETTMCEELQSFLGINRDNTGWYGDKFIVLTAYVKGKIRVGKLTYLNEYGEPVTIPVDENYKKGTHPYEVSLEWGYTDKWFKGIKIGDDLYSYEPLEFLNCCPIIGGDFDVRNSPIKSFIDMMKPFQVLYNIVMNQLFRLLQKEIGVVYNIVLRKIPNMLKDGDDEDALNIWENEAREKGIVFEDDTIENMGVPGNNTNNSRAIDLTRTAEIQSRYTLAQQLKAECMALIGVTPQRLGDVAATSTLGGTQVAMSQSYSQTSPWFMHHHYVLNQFYQTLLDAALYYETRKPESTISYISGEGEHIFIQVNADNLDLRDLRVFITDRNEDLQVLQQMRGLTQSMLQNGVSPYEVSKLLETKSVRAVQDMFKKLKDLKDQFEQQQQQLAEQANQLKAQEIQQQQQQFEIERNDKNMNAALDRASKERIAAIQVLGNENNRSNNVSSNDIMDIMKFSAEQNQMQKQLDITQNQTDNKHMVDQQKLNVLQQKLQFDQQKQREQIQENEKNRQLKREELAVQKQIAKENKN